MYRRLGRKYRIYTNVLTCNCIKLPDDTIVMATDLSFHLSTLSSMFSLDNLKLFRHMNDNALNQLKLLGVRVIFEQEELDTASTDSDLMISIIEPIAQAENESRSYNVKWGIKQHATNSTPKLYNRKCYGYVNSNDGSLKTKDEETKNVRLIFNMYLRGKSVIGIVSELERIGIKSPVGKGKWCKLN